MLEKKFGQFNGYMFNGVAEPLNAHTTVFYVFVRGAMHTITRVTHIHESYLFKWNNSKFTVQKSLYCVCRFKHVQIDKSSRQTKWKREHTFICS